MPPATTDPTRTDPYRHFRCRVRWEGRQVAGFSQVGAVQRDAAAATRGDRAAHPARPATGDATLAWLRLERGLTHDAAFVAWASLPGPDDARQAVRKDVVIELYDEAGELAATCTVHGCRVASFEAIPALDAKATGVAIATLTLARAGWARDAGAGLPAEAVTGQAPADTG